MRCKSLIHWPIITLLILFSVSATQAAEQKSGNWEGIKQTMTEAQFRATGLDKLSPPELRLLDRWLLKFLAHDSQQIVHNDKTIKKLQQVPVLRRIKGNFRGWSGKTVFHLDNGEVWKQRLSGRYAISLESPKVEIYKNLFGFYELKIVETGRKIGVTRVK
jgi:hypothetical protein